LKIHIDGGARGNPGPAAIGAVLRDDQNQYFLSEYIGPATNNVAEYTAMEKALEKAVSLGIKQVQVFSDSELMVKQLNGIYRVKNDTLRVIYNRVNELIKNFDNIEIIHVRREFNKEADSLVNKALDERK